MIRFLFRFFGLWILAAGFIFLIYDGTKAIADRAIYITKAGEVWTSLHQSSLAATQAALERHAAFVWDPVLRTILEQPAWLVLGVLGIVLMLVGKKPKPLIGYAR